jgi:hypothetical protein
MEKETFLWTLDRVPGICIRDDYQYEYRVKLVRSQCLPGKAMSIPMSTGKSYVGSNVYRVKLCRFQYLPGKPMSVTMSTG